MVKRECVSTTKLQMVYRGIEQWWLVGLITQRSGVRIPLPQLNKPTKLYYDTGNTCGLEVTVRKDWQIMLTYQWMLISSMPVAVSLKRWFESNRQYNKRVSYNGYYSTLPMWRWVFDSFYPHKWAWCRRQVNWFAIRLFGFDSHSVHKKKFKKDLVDWNKIPIFVKEIKWSHRLTVRTLGFHPRNRSSILRGTTMKWTT